MVVLHQITWTCYYVCILLKFSFFLTSTTFFWLHACIVLVELYLLHHFAPNLLHNVLLYIKFKFVTLCCSSLFYFDPPHTPLPFFRFCLHMHVCLWQLFVLLMQLVLNLVKIRKVDVKDDFLFITKDNDVFKFGLRCKITIIIVFGCCCILNTFHERYDHELCEVENGSNPMICKTTFIFSSFDL